ncbi:MAG: SGNH/GDSL hydrolase family protein [Bryobacteraceae bacterium]
MTRFECRFLPLCAALALHASMAASPASRIERMYVFGDSYSDTGAGYLDGNGPTAVAYLAERLGFRLFNSTDPGASDRSLNFAVSGAGTGQGSGTRIGGALLGLGMQNQVDDFAERVHLGRLQFKPESTLFFIAGGLNDGELPTETTVRHVKKEIRELYNAGGRRFTIALLPESIPDFSAVARRLNPALARIPDEIRGELSGASVTSNRWGLYFDEVLRDPGRYGIKNTTAKCAGRQIFHEDPTPCAHPETYFYYHAGHPSTAAHKVVGEKLFEELRGH